MEINKEILLNDLLAVLHREKQPDMIRKKSVNYLVKETDLSSDKLSEAVRSWESSGGKFQAHTSFAENRRLFAQICAALLEDDFISPDSYAFLKAIASKISLDAPRLDSLFDAKKKFQAERDFDKRTETIELFFNSSAAAGARSENGASRMPQKTHDGHLYIANQVTYEGLDEIQRLLMAHHLGIHAAIDGPPGVGKTQSVVEISRILGLKLYTKTCSSRTTESHIISYPALTVKDRVSVTSHINGPLCRAMTEGAIFYGDEFNLLKEDVQKRLNSAFDERRLIDRSDGETVKGQTGFWGVISYNPTQNLISRDLEDSVADRFIHLHYERWSADFKAYVSAMNARNASMMNLSAQEDYDIQLGWRGVSGLRFFNGVAADPGKAVAESGLKWFDFFTGRPASRPEYVYRVFDRNSIFKKDEAQLGKILNELAAQSYSEIELARIISRFTELLQSLARTGESPLLKKIGLSDLREKEDLELLSLHESSTRIEAAALMHYRHLLTMGCNRYLAQSYSVRLVIDQVCFGQYRMKKLREQTVYSLVSQIARSLRLFADNTKYNTRLIAENILKS